MNSERRSATKPTLPASVVASYLPRQLRRVVHNPRSPWRRLNVPVLLAALPPLPVGVINSWNGSMMCVCFLKDGTDPRQMRRNARMARRQALL